MKLALLAAHLAALFAASTAQAVPPVARGVPLSGTGDFLPLLPPGATSPKLFSLKWAKDAGATDTDYRLTGTTLEGAVPVISDELVVSDGVIRKYAIEFKQTGEKGSVTSDGKRLKFEYFTADGKRETDEEDATDDLAVPTTIATFVSARWDELVKPKGKLKSRLAVVERQETVGFDFTQEGETEFGGKAAVIVKMTPTSWIIARLVDPLYLTFEKAAPHALLELQGRVLPKRKDGSKWKPIDARIVYNY